MNEVNRFGMVILFSLIISSNARDTLNPGQTLLQGQYLQSRNRRFRIAIKSNGNVVLTAKRGRRRRAIWISDSKGNGSSPYRLRMKKNGNLVLYDKNNDECWASDTRGNPGSRVILQNNRDFVMYKPGRRRIWNTRTGFYRGRGFRKVVVDGGKITRFGYKGRRGKRHRRPRWRGRRHHRRPRRHHRRPRHSWWRRRRNWRRRHHGGGGGGHVGNGTYFIFGKQSGKVMDVWGDQRHNGAALIIWPLHRGGNQRFRVHRHHNGYSLTGQNCNKVIDISGWGRHNGATIHMWQWHGGSNQRWDIIHRGGGYFYIRSRHSGKVLDVAGWGTHNGARIHQWQFHGGSNQLWRFVRV